MTRAIREKVRERRSDVGLGDGFMATILTESAQLTSGDERRVSVMLAALIAAAR
jgi:ABC-type uncharacterized transport system YnjBCD permease subunit